MSDSRSANLKRAQEILKGIPETETAEKPDDDPRRRRRQARADEARQSVGLQKLLAYFAVSVMGAQILLADLVFTLYGAFNGWQIPSEAIIAWLTATVVEVIGLVLVITRRLFATRKPTK